MVPRRLFRPALRPELARQPFLLRRPRRPAARWESTTTGDEKSGHIAAAANESILFFDNLFPLGLNGVLGRLWNRDRDLSDLLKRFESSSLGSMDPINMVKRAIPASLPIRVTEIVPRLKDGGAFVKFSHPAEVAAGEIERELAKMLREQPIKPWFNPFRAVQAGLVRGVPWLEDLYRFPKNRVRVEFVAPAGGGAGAAAELSQEDLYSLFRRYGKIAEITSQPSDSKVVPRFAFVDFPLVRHAVMARTCLHGLVVPEAQGGGRDGTRLRLSYEQRVRAHHVWDWLTSHPRIVVPVVAALLAAATVVVFDPIREFFVRVHVQHSFRLSNSRLYKWFARHTSDILSFRRPKAEEAGLNALWSHRRDIIDTVQTWLLETADTFIVVQGPRGSGTKELVVDRALRGREKVLVVDCKPVAEARGEAATLKRLAAAVGYRPVFSWANSISSLVDLAVQSTTGVKAGFSETFESQLVKILHTTAAALKQVSLAGRTRDDKDAALPEDAFLEAHPERRVVVVFDNFLPKNDADAIVYDKMAEWAAALVQSNIAHVIFLTTNDTSYSKALSKSLPDRVFRHVALGDLSPDVAESYVLSHLDSEEPATQKGGARAGHEEGKEAPAEAAQSREDLRKELDGCIGTLGGRLTDLEFLARRLRSGQRPRRAVAEIVDQSATELLKMFLLPSNQAAGGPDRRWSVEQAWYLVCEIAQRESLRYNEVLLSPTFASSTTAAAADGEAALESLASAELITVHARGRSGGRPQTIRAGKPVYQAAFAQLRADPALRARMDLAVLAELARIEAKTIEKAESELVTLASLPRQPPQTAERVTYLLTKLQASQRKIAAYEAQMAGFKKVLSEEP